MPSTPSAPPEWDHLDVLVFVAIAQVGAGTGLRELLAFVDHQERLVLSESEVERCLSKLFSAGLARAEGVIERLRPTARGEALWESVRRQEWALARSTLRHRLARDFGAAAPSEEPFALPDGAYRAALNDYLVASQRLQQR